MRRVSLEAWILLIPAAALFVLLTLVAAAFYDYEPPKFAQLPLLVCALASPVIALGVIAVTFVLRLSGALRFRHPYVLAGVALACLNLLLAAGIVVVLSVAGSAVRGIMG